MLEHIPQSLKDVIQLIKEDEPDYKAIFSLWGNVRKINYLGKVELLKEALVSRAVNKETLWLMAMFGFQDLLIQAFQKKIQAGELIDLNFISAVAGANRTILHYIVGRYFMKTIQFLLNYFEKNIELDWNFAPTEGQYEGESVLWLLAYYEKFDLIENILKKDPGCISQLNWDATSPKGIDKYKSVLWLLAESERFDLIKVLLEQNSRFIFQLKWNFAPMEWESKGKSVLWLLAVHKRFDLIKVLLEQGSIFVSQLNWNVAPMEWENKGKSVLWLLAYYGRFDLIEVLLEQDSIFITYLDWNTAPMEGINKGKAVLWYLAIYKRFDLIEKLLAQGSSFTSQLNWNASPMGWIAENKSVLWLLAESERFDLIEILLVQNPGLVFKLNWSATPGSWGINYPSVLWLLIKNMQWQLVELVITIPTLAVKGWKPKTSIYSGLLKCNNAEQRSKLIKTYLLVNTNPTIIPNNCKTEIEPYQIEINEALERVAIVVANERDKNPFNNFPSEIKEIILKIFLEYEFPGIPWKLLRDIFYRYVKERNAKLQVYAYRAVAYHVCHVEGTCFFFG